MFCIGPSLFSHSFLSLIHTLVCPWTTIYKYIYLAHFIECLLFLCIDPVLNSHCSSYLNSRLLLALYSSCKRKPNGNTIEEKHEQRERRKEREREKKKKKKKKKLTKKKKNKKKKPNPSPPPPSSSFFFFFFFFLFICFFFSLCIES